MAVTIFADGASSGNPGPSGWGAIIADSKNVLEIGGGSARATNNQMELMAVVKALEAVLSKEPITIHTDSTYVLKGIQEWVPKWRKSGWKTVQGADVQNRDLWEELDDLAKTFKITWNKILGHSGIPGNERADEIAVAYAKGLTPKLYDGPTSNYKINISDLKSKTNPKGATYSYLSLVSGVAKRHKTWAECEQRVKGAANAKYRKTTSPEDEKMILESWGVDL
jgi:ribonuclease HI